MIGIMSVKPLHNAFCNDIETSVSSPAYTVNTILHRNIYANAPVRQSIHASRCIRRLSCPSIHPSINHCPHRVVSNQMRDLLGIMFVLLEERGWEHHRWHTNCTIVASAWLAASVSVAHQICLGHTKNESHNHGQSFANDFPFRHGLA
jgi:hypothetical protein